MIMDVSRKFICRLLASPGKTYEPRGLYLCEDVIDGKPIWTAIDNSTGDAWTEEFWGRNSATLWLHGYAATNIYGEKLEGTR